MNNSQARTFLERLFPYPAIGHDDPNAVKKLNDKLEKLQAKQELWKAINSIIRKSSKEPVIAMTAICKLDDRITQEVASGLLLPDFVGRVGIPSFELTNNNGGIQAIHGRLAKIQRVESMEEFSEIRNGVTIEIDKGLNRITLHFPFRPEQPICNHLKHCGYRWAPSKGMWLGNISKYRLQGAKKVWELVPQVQVVPEIIEIVDMTSEEMIAVLSEETVAA